MSEVKRTPLFEAHKRAGAKFVEFAGWELPIHYGSIVDEAKAVRASCGMFDVSHMGRMFVQACNRASVQLERDEGCGMRDRGNGGDVAKVLDWLVTIDVSGMAIGQVRYGFLCNEWGGIIDDLTIARLSENEFIAVVNAARRENDFVWMRKQLTQ